MCVGAISQLSGVWPCLNSRSESSANASPGKLSLAVKYKTEIILLCYSVITLTKFFK